MKGSASEKRGRGNVGLNRVVDRPVRKAPCDAPARPVAGSMRGLAENLHASESETNPIEAANFFGQLYRDLQEAARKPNESL